MTILIDNLDIQNGCPSLNISKAQSTEINVQIHAKAPNSFYNSIPGSYILSFTEIFIQNEEFRRLEGKKGELMYTVDQPSIN